MHHLHPLASNISIYFSQTTVPIITKLDRHVAWIVLNYLKGAVVVVW